MEQGDHPSPTMLVSMQVCWEHLAGNTLWRSLLQVGAPCPQIIESVAAEVGVELRCIRREENDVQARLLIASEISTDAVLHHDDDVLIRLKDISLALRVWKRHRDQIVGFEPRVHRHDPLTGWSYGFHLSEGYVTSPQDTSVFPLCRKPHAPH